MKLFGEAVLDAEVRIGELMANVPKATVGSGGNRYKKATEKSREIPTGRNFSKNETTSPKTKKDAAEKAGLDKRQVSYFEALAANPDLVEEAKNEAREKDTIVTRSSVLKKVKAKKKKEEVRQAEKSIHDQASDEYKPHIRIGNSIGYQPAEKYDLLLTDPPCD